MVDVVSPADRSRMMAGIKGKNSQPELLVRRLLFASGYRFRLHRHDLPGTPDIVMPSRKVAIFIHGCFWHWHGCHLSKMPASNTAFWKTKLEANHERDLLAQLTLISAGWRTVTIWECALRGKAATEKLPDQLRDLGQWIRDRPEAMTYELKG